MLRKTLGLMVVLSLLILLAVPSMYTLRVRGVSEGGGIQSFIPPFSAFGPRQQQITFQVYDNDVAMLSDFDAGLLDITDAPDLAGRLNCATNPACDQSNPNYYVTNPRAELGEEQLDISHQVSFLGKAMQCLRTTTDPSCSPAFAPGNPSITINSDAAVACDSTHFQLTVHLKNIEEGGALVQDQNEVITATPIAGTASSLSSTTGTYNLGCVTALPPAYVVSTAVYGDASGNTARVEVFTSAGTGSPQCVNNRLCDIDFKVDYRSPSTKKPTVASIELGRALSHLVDKPAFVTIPVLSGRASCDDILGSPAWGLMTSVGAPTYCSATNGGGIPATEVSAQTVDSECSDLSSSAGKPPGFVAVFTPGNCFRLASLYNIVEENIHAGDASTGIACGATNSLGVQIPSGNCFPSQGNFKNSVPILPEAGYSGSLDLTAACNYLLLAGFTLSPIGATCADAATGNAVNGQTAHLDNNGQQISLIIRRPGNLPGRTRFGQIEADELNFLFGTPAPSGGTICYGFLSPTPGPGATCSNLSTPVYFFVGQISQPIFQVNPTWNLYTGGQSHDSTPNTLLSAYHSRFASSTCGGTSATFPRDYDEYCDPQYDTQVASAELSPSFASSFTFFQNAATIAATRGMLVPMISRTDQFLALNTWNTEVLGSSLVPSFGHGFDPGSPGQYWSLLNMRPNGLVNSGKYQPGGGVPGLIRRSISGGSLAVSHQNIFTLGPFWELDLAQLMYDSMLIVNPNTGGSNLQLIDWMTKSHSTSFDSTSGKATQVFNLRNDICWQDSLVGPAGQPCDRPVTADDICFTILAQRDGPGVASTEVSDVVSCSFPDPQTVVVLHNGIGTFQDLNIGSLRIVPAHIWGMACNWPNGPHDSSHEPTGVAGAPCVQAGFDPTAVTFNGAPFATPLPPNVSGMMVGSGPYVCIVPPGFANAGKIGGSCALDINFPPSLAGQALNTGYTERLVRFLGYMRCCDDTQGSNLEALGWADANKDGKVTIVDASALSFAFGSNNRYFDHPLYGSTAGSVDVGEAAFLANAFDSGTIAPCINLTCPGPPIEPNPSAPLLGPDRALDPYLADLSFLGSFSKVYYMGLTLSSGGGQLELASIGASDPSSGSFTATIGATTVAGTADPEHSGNIVFNFSPLSQGHYNVQVKFTSTQLGRTTTTVIFNINT